MWTSSATKVATQEYRIYIKATPEAVWDGITKPDLTEKYGYAVRQEFDLRPGGKFRALASEGMRASGSPEVACDGEVIEVSAPRRLVQTWRMPMDENLAREGFTRLTWQIDPVAGGVTRVTLTHELENAPTMATLVAGGMEDQGAGGGWVFILSGLKTLLETGGSLQHQG